MNGVFATLKLQTFNFNFKKFWKMLLTPEILKNCFLNFRKKKIFKNFLKNRFNILIRRKMGNEE